MNVWMRWCLLTSAAALVAGCSSTTTGEASAPSNVTAYSTTTSEEPTIRTPPPSSPAAPEGIPPAAFDEIRAQGVAGSDEQIRDLIDIACIMSESSFNDSKQDVVDVMQQMGSELSDPQLEVVVTVALTYSCPENAGKLGG